MSMDERPSSMSASWAKNVKVARAFRDFEDDIIGVDFTRDGTIVCAYSKSQIAVYDISGVLKRRVRSAERISKVLLKPSDPGYAFVVLNKEPENQNVKLGTHIRLVDLFIDQVFFELHTDTSLLESISFVSLHPSADTFLLGTTFYCSLWDYSGCLKNTSGPLCLGKTPTLGVEICGNYDSQGICFAMGTGTGQLQLFDSKTFVKGSFLSFDVQNDEENQGGQCTCEFSPCGKYILYNHRFLLDAYDGDPVVTYPMPGLKMNAPQLAKKELVDTVIQDANIDSITDLNTNPKEKTSEEVTDLNTVALHQESCISKDSEPSGNVDKGPSENPKGPSENQETVEPEKENDVKMEELKESVESKESQFQDDTNAIETEVIPQQPLLSEAHFSPDSEFVMQVSGGGVYLFSTTNAALERTLVGEFAGPTLTAHWNPSRAMIVTASGTDMQWWI